MLNKKVFKLSKIFVPILLISLVGLGTLFLPLQERVKAYDPETSGDITITITEVTPDHQTQIGKSATNVALMKIVVENTSTTATYTWTDLTVTYTGTRDSDIATAGVNLHLSGTSTGDIKFERTLSASQATFAMSGSDAEIGPSASSTYYISLDTAAAPTHGDTLGFRIDAGDMTFYCASPAVTISDLPGGTRNSETATIDSAAPTISSAETGDYNSDGKIDNYKITFSETIDLSELTADNANGFLVAGYSGEKVCMNAAGSDCNPADDTDTNVLYLLFTAGSADTDATPDLTYSGSAVKDIASPANSLAEVVTGTVTEVDKAKPVVLLTDGATKSNPNSSADEHTLSITIKYSEDVSGSTLTDTDFTVLNSNNQQVDISTTSISTDTITLTLDQADTDNNTDQMSVAYTASSVTDGTNNADTFTDTVVTDAVEPVMTAQEYRDNDDNGQVDQVRLTFSEKITYSSYEDADWSVTANGITSLDVSAGTTSDSTTLNLTASADAGITGGTAPTITYDASNGASDITDGTNTLATTTNATLADAAAPVALLTNATTKSNPNSSANQYTKEITIKYSEDISASTASTSEFTVLNTGDAEVTISSASESTDTLTLVLAQLSPNDTDQMSVAYSGTSIVDAVALAAANFGDTVITDAVEPVVLTQNWN